MIGPIFRLKFLVLYLIWKISLFAFSCKNSQRKFLTYVQFNKAPKIKQLERNLSSAKFYNKELFFWRLQIKKGFVDLILCIACSFKVSSQFLSATQVRSSEQTKLLLIQTALLEVDHWKIWKWIIWTCLPIPAFFM